MTSEPPPPPRYPGPYDSPSPPPYGYPPPGQPAYPPPAGPPPEQPPEPRVDAEGRPRWPWWYALAGFAAAFLGTIVFGGVTALLVAAIAESAGVEEADSLAVVAGTLVQYTFFVAAAIGFAYLTLKPRPWHFGFRKTRFWPAVGWCALGGLAFYLFSFVYSLLFTPDAEQTVGEDLGLADGTAAVIVGGVLIVVIAPVVEELFFRGFFYRALRGSLAVWSAAAITGVVFGLVHFNPVAPETIQLVPVLGFLGIVFCLVYERTGSLYAVIALHALNNMLALGVLVDTGTGWAVAGALGLAMVSACTLAPRFASRDPAPAPAS